jgi:hypothetical protein
MPVEIKFLKVELDAGFVINEPSFIINVDY